MNNIVNFGEQLKKIRQNKNQSQEDLANFTNLHRTYISMLEREQRNPTLSTLLKLTRALNIKIFLRSGNFFMKDNNQSIEKQLNDYLLKSSKEFQKKRSSHDLLMDIFNITPKEKQKNGQYWGRQLGKLWEKLITTIFKNSSSVQNFTGKIRVKDERGNSDEPADLSGNGYGIDTKYRMGSGDSKFNKQFKENADILKNKNLIPIMLVLRKDNLKQCIHAAESAGWKIYEGEYAFKFVEDQTDYNLIEFLKKYQGKL